MRGRAQHHLNRTEMKALSAAQKSGMPFVCCADNSTFMIINGRRYCPDFVFYGCILVEVDGYLVHNNDQALQRDKRLQEDIDANNYQKRKEMEQNGKSMLKELHLLRFWARDIERDPLKNFIIPIKQYVRLHGISA
ncbi:MAG: hypothetical protein ABI337_04245 [Nitrososphaera sp.]